MSTSPALTFAEAARLVHPTHGPEARRAAKLFAASLKLCNRAISTTNEAKLYADVGPSCALIERARRQLAASARLQHWANQWQWRALQ